MEYQQYNEIKARLTSATETDTLDHKDGYSLRMGLLMKKTPNGLRRVIRQNEKESILREAHSSLTAGHFRFGKTIKLIKQRFWWPNMVDDIKEFIESCDSCQRKDTPRQTQELRPIPVTGPFQRVGMDIIGPLPRSYQDNVCIVVAIDYHTKWVEARALPNMKAPAVAQFIFEDIICRHGCPEVIQTDGGKSFANQLVRELCDQFGIRHQLVLAYRPQSNGMVERTNRIIGTAISKYVLEDQQEWDRYLPGILLAHRSTFQSSARFTPFYLTYGREAQLPIDLEFPSNVEYTAQNLDQRVSAILNRLEPVRVQALSNIEKAQTRQKRNHDDKIQPYRYKIGDKVLLYKSDLATSHSAKLRSKWDGPFYIPQSLGKNAYKLRTLDGRVLVKVVHGDRLKLYKDRLHEPVVHIDLPDPPEEQPEENPNDGQPEQQQLEQQPPKRRSPRRHQSSSMA